MLKKLLKKDLKIAEKHYFTKSAGAGAKCDHFKLGVRTLIWTCEVRACDPKNGRNSHLVKTMVFCYHNCSDLL